MTVIHIPFTQGQSEAVDSKLLPQGLFTVAQNVRYQKDARLGVRAAYRRDPSGQAPDTVVASVQHDDKVVLSIVAKADYASPAAYDIHDNGAYVANSTGVVTAGAWLGVFQSLVAKASLLPSAAGYGAVDCVSSGGILYVVAGSSYTLSTKASYNNPVGLTYVVYRALPDGTITHSKGMLNCNASKLVIVNGILCVFWADTATDAIMMQGYSLATLGTVTAATTVVTSLAGKNVYFDVSAGGSSTEAYLVYMSAANTLRFGTVTSAGVFTQLSTIAGTNAELRPSISPTGMAPTDQVVITWNDGATFATGNAKYTVYRRSTTSFLIGTTTVDASNKVQGYPVVAAAADSSDWYACFNVAATALSAPHSVGRYVSGGSASYVYGARLASKPFVAGSVFAGVIVTNNDDSTAANGSYYVVDIGHQAQSSNYVGADAMFAQFYARPSDATATLADPRRKVAAGTAFSLAPGAAAIAVALPTQTGITAGFRLFQAEYGTRGDNWIAAKLNGQTVLSGPMIRTFDGQVVNEDNYHVPPPATLSASGGGMAAGTYQVCYVYEGFDASGRRVRSAPSLPQTITLIGGGASSAFNISLDGPYFASQYYPFALNAEQSKVRVYRTTLTQPTVFRDAFGTAQSVGPNNMFSPLVTLSDASIASNEILYTQGAQGGLSGELQNDQPPGCKYIWAGSDRLIIGGLENPSEAWLSKLRTQGEPMQWANFDAYKVQVDGRVTAVAEMDGTWIVFTYNSIWVVTGAGPEDTGANGSFNAPRRLPTDIGCISHKSLLMTGEGLIFQGRPDCLFLLPRGGGEARAIGWEVSETLAAFPYVAASAFNQKSNVCYWAITNTAGTAGRLLVFDTRNWSIGAGTPGIWYVDNVCAGRAIKALCIYDGKLLIDGSIIETAGNFADFDGSTTTNVIPTLTTGDIRPFGLSGTGRLRKVTILGEARNVAIASTPSLEVSYDSGKTYAESVTWPVASLASAIGDAIDGAEHLLKYPRGDTFRFRLSWSTPSATEGVVWHGLSIEAYGEDGLKRQPNSRRT